MTETVLKQGIVEIVGANAVWIDPVVVLNNSYSDYEVSHGRYYSRSSFDTRRCSTAAALNESTGKSSRKRKRKKTYAPNEKELLAELRHQESRFAILNAHSSFLATAYPKISKITVDSCSNARSMESADAPGSITNGQEECQMDFLRLAEVWQAPLYELIILGRPLEIRAEGGPDTETEKLLSNTCQLFNSVIEHNDEEAVAECAGATFLLPRCCRFLISDVTQTHQLIPDNSNSGFNLIVIDPPWENKSVHRKSLYPMIPNRQLLSLPVKKLGHKEGALVALWLTNREKLHQFVVNELFPAWGVKTSATWYWLKLNGFGEMISPLDLQHHKPYECLLLGYLLNESQKASSAESSRETVSNKVTACDEKPPPDKFVLMSIPGDHSRKPPIGSLLARYAPGPHPIKGLELFARELSTGWTSWGNEPLHFQNLKYFQQKI